MTTKPKTKPGPPASPAAAVVPPQSEGIMPQQIVPVTLEETWKLLRPGIVEVFEREPMSVKRYMALFKYPFYGLARPGSLFFSRTCFSLLF